MGKVTDAVKNELKQLGEVLDDPTKAGKYITDGAKSAYKAIDESPWTDTLTREALAKTAELAANSHAPHSGPVAAEVTRRLSKVEPVREITHKAAAGYGGYLAGAGRALLTAQTLPSALLYKGAKKLLGL